MRDDDDVSVKFLFFFLSKNCHLFKKKKKTHESKKGDKSITVSVEMRDQRQEYREGQTKWVEEKNPFSQSTQLSFDGRQRVVLKLQTKFKLNRMLMIVQGK